MRQHQLKPPAGSKHAKKRIGRGSASGQGTTAGKGTKGQKARSGGGVRPGFEGGQLPIIKRLPHIRGFKNIFKTQYIVVNIGQLNRFEAQEEVTPERMQEVGLVATVTRPIKVLGDGEISKVLTVSADRFSASAKAKIEAAGGTVLELARA